MADINSGVPIRTQLPSQANYDDVIFKLGDSANPATQQASVDTNGSMRTRLSDALGNIVTSQANGAQRALDVGINVGGVQIDPRQIRALTSADVVTANQGSANTSANGWPIKITDGTSVAFVTPAATAALVANPALVVALSPNSPLPAGTNVIGQVNQAAGSNPWIVKDVADGSATGGTAGTFSLLAGAIYNSALPTLTTGQQVGLQVDASGRLITRPLTAADVVTSNQGAPNSAANAWPTKITDGTNTAAVKAASTAPVAADPALVVAISPNSLPLPVTISVDNPGTEIDAFNTASAVAAGATSNHDYTVTALKTLLLTQIEASASGKMKIEVQIESGVATNTFATRFVQFNSAANTNCTITLKAPISVAAGVRVRVIRTNKDLLAQDVYSTICGQEIP